MPELTSHRAPAPRPIAPADGTIRRLLGEAAWGRLNPNVRARFAVKPAPGQVLTFVGTMTEVRRSWFGWLLASACRLIGTPLPPQQGRQVPAIVRIYRAGDGDGIVWERRYQFGRSRPFTMRSTKRPDGARGLLECAGYGFAMRLRLFERDGALHFASTGYCLELGGRRVTLPDLFTPGQALVTHRDEGGGRFRFTMAMAHRWFGESFFQDGLFHQVTEGDATNPNSNS
ncbi:MAG: DUF4166 domain-containing protein [Dongiaceae bacterium]